MSSPRSFWPAFQKRWAAVLCEQTEGLDAWSENMTQALRRGILEVPNSAEAHAALGQLNVRLSRLQSARLAADETFFDETTRSLFVGYGAAILRAPAHPAEMTDSANGVLQYAELKAMLDHLCDWLRLLRLMPRRVFSFEDLDSQIIGRVLARQLDIEFAVANGDGYTHSKSLIVCADNRLLLAAPLRTIFPAQVLYSFNLHRQGGVIVPDVSGTCVPNLLMPWQEERLSSRKIAGVVERISNLPLIPLSPPVADDWQARLEFYRRRREWLTAGNSCYSRALMLPESI